MAKAKAAVVEAPKADPRPVGVLIALLDKNREKRREIDKQLAPFESDYKELKKLIIEKLDAEKSTKGACATASVSISEVEVPVIEDIKLLVAHIKRHNLWHLFLAQPLTTPSWREAKALKGADLPGTATFIKRDLNHASIKS
jgi:hypothetical protein